MPAAMPVTISESMLQQFSAFLSRRMGLHFPRERWPDMLRGLERAASAFALPDAEACMRWLLAAPLERRQVETLASQLTVGETYFWREPAALAALEREVLPALIAARRASGERRLRLWSAGCCTGEEPYSVAVLLSRLLPDLDEWNISLLATDINPHFLAKALRGEYREWSFRGAPAWLRADYFSPSGAGNYTLAPRIRRLVSFAYLNLVDDVYPALDNNTNAIDVVLCRNVLMYFEADAMRAVLDKFRRALNDGGWLLVSPTEASVTMFSGFAAAGFADAILYRKGAPQPASLPAPPVRAPIDVPAPFAWPPAEAPVALEPLPPALPAAPPAAPAAGDAYRRAQAHYAQGDYAAAVAALAASAPDDVAGLALAARACANQGQFDAACGWCAAAVERDKFDPGLRYLLASVLAEQGRSDAAVAALRQALYLDQDFVLAHFALGNLYRRLGQPAPAARHFATARTLLAGYPPGQALPDAEGLTAGRLLDIIGSAECVA